MTEQPDSVCPECGATKVAHGPYCDNCGYRMGRADTEVEGHHAIAREAISRRKPVGVETEIERPAIKPRSQRGPLLESTEIEGIPVIGGSLVPTERNEPINPANFAVPDFAPALPTETNTPVDVKTPVPMAPETVADLVPVTSLGDPVSEALADAADDSSSTPMWIVAWVASLVATAMVVHHLAAPPPDAPAVPIAAADAPKPTRIEVSASSFHRGLEEGVRSMILKTCLQMSDDKSECEHDELLAGEFPAEQVEVAAFSIDALEVTVGDYGKCAEAGACEVIDWKNCRVYTLNGLQVSLRAPKSLRGPDVAVSCVARSQASAFCAWRSGRLPTHDEWERSARGAADKRIYPWGSVWEPLHANWGELDVVRMPVAGAIDGHERVATPGHYPDGVSPIGAHDMAGNVAEWVADDPPVARGGAWTSTPFDLRVTGRMELDAEERRTDVGFRCAY